MPEHFFIIGAQRSGTSYLYTVLDEHPEVTLARPRRPEPKFFLSASNTEKGRSHYEQTYFGETTASVWGEKSTSYIEHPEAASRIAAWYPSARILAVLREPVARAISNYRFSVENGVETLPVWEALNRSEAEVDDYDRSRFSTSPWAYLRRGRYVDQLRGWLAAFPREQIYIELFERLVADVSCVRAVYGFLSVDDSFRAPSAGSVVNAGDPSVDTGLSEDQLHELHERFEAPNEQLAQELALDLSPWEP